MQCNDCGKEIKCQNIRGRHPSYCPECRDKKIKQRKDDRKKNILEWQRNHKEYLRTYAKNQRIKFQEEEKKKNDAINLKNI